MFGKFEFHPEKKKRGKEPGIEEAVQELNEKIIREETSYVQPETSIEEKAFAENFGNKFDALQQKYFELRQEILDKEKEIAEIRMRKNSISNRAKRLTLKELNIDAPDQTLREMTRNAEDRMDMLAKRIKSREENLESIEKEFEEVKKSWEAIVGLVALTDEEFDPSLN